MSARAVPLAEAHPAAAPGAADATTRAVLAALGLSHSPFPPTPDATHYFATPALERDLAEARHCLLGRKGFVLLTGEVGQGKTTFLRRLLRAVEGEGARSSLIFNTFLQGPDLLAAVLRDFGLRPGRDAAGNIARLNRFLLACWRAGTTCVLFIDDAQNLDAESLELLRLLTNLESGQEKLLQIVLAGQPELEEALRAHGLRQLASRIVKHVRLAPLDPSSLASYVDFRLACAGDEGRVRLDGGARAALFRHSGGNPRRAHLIMDRCLYGVIAGGSPVVDAALVRRAADEAGFAPMAPMQGVLHRLRQATPWRTVALVLAGSLLAGGLLALGLANASPTPPNDTEFTHGRG